MEPDERSIEDATDGNDGPGVAEGGDADPAIGDEVRRDPNEAGRNPLDGFRTADATVWTGRGPSSEQSSEASPADDRGSRLYDWWSRRSRLYDAVIGMGASIREDALDALGATSGETVLDLGCGPGTNFDRLRADVGTDGRVVGLDYSRGMVERATTLVAEREWSNVHVVLGDATETCGAPEAFDAVVATWSLHTMADAATVVDNVYRALVPGGRFVVMDARPMTDGPARYLNPAYERAIAWAVDHQRGQDTLALLDSTFEAVDLVDTYDAGAGYVAVARKEATDRTDRPAGGAGTDRIDCEE